MAGETGVVVFEPGSGRLRVSNKNDPGQFSFFGVCLNVSAIHTREHSISRPNVHLMRASGLPNVRERSIGWHLEKSVRSSEFCLAWLVQLFEASVAAASYKHRIHLSPFGVDANHIHTSLGIDSSAKKRTRVCNALTPLSSCLPSGPPQYFRTRNSP